MNALEKVVLLHTQRQVNQLSPNTIVVCGNYFTLTDKEMALLLGELLYKCAPDTKSGIEEIDLAREAYIFNMYNTADFNVPPTTYGMSDLENSEQPK